MTAADKFISGKKAPCGSFADIDILEDDINAYNPRLLDILLRDRTTGGNIVWATDNYAGMGDAYLPDKPILPELIIGANTRVIQPRIAKSREVQLVRIRDKAEVFTPSWICNTQNNLIDRAWFGRSNVFNTAKKQGWSTRRAKIVFPDTPGKTWRDYVDAPRLEIACGEAPYLVSPYDTVTGKPIPLDNRIGLLDRKIRVVNENTGSEAEWLRWMLRAFQSVYAYEYQGDSLLLARENLMFTFVGHLQARFHRRPAPSEAERFADVISWNIWQMDAFTGAPPFADTADEPLLGRTPQWCRIKNWRESDRRPSGRIHTFKHISEKRDEQRI